MRLGCADSTNPVDSRPDTAALKSSEAASAAVSLYQPGTTCSEKCSPKQSIIWAMSLDENASGDFNLTSISPGTCVALRSIDGLNVAAPTAACPRPSAPWARAATGPLASEADNTSVIDKR